MTTIRELAEMTGTTEGDVLGFVAGIKICMDKGMAFEAAIERHMQVMTRLAENAHVFASDPKIRSQAGEMVWDAVNKKEAA